MAKKRIGFSLYSNNILLLLKNTGIDLALLLFSILLFALSFPNFLFVNGLFPLAFISIVPVFIVVYRCGWIRIFIYGAIFGFLCYVLLNYWLVTFHPLAIFIVPLIYAVYFFFLFPVLKLIDKFFPKYGYFLQAFIWVIYEFLRIQGYLGYAYGILGYTQYLFLPLARLASLTGIWGVTLIVVFPSVFLGNGFKKGLLSFKPFIKKNLPVVIAYCCIFLIVIIYGLLSTVNLKTTRKWKAALIQQNSEPWQIGYIAYMHTLDKLISLSEKAQKEEPEIIVWSETAFVPAIYYHNRYRENREAYRVVKKLLDFLAMQKIPYVVGNDDGRKIKTGTPDEKRIDYNASILFKDGKMTKIYRKVHLVPFTEHFPYKDALPWLHQMLVEADTHFWEKGKEYTVFKSDGIFFSTPICFEDTFGYLCRRFVKNGANVLVNLSNDSWSGSIVSEIQHLAMAVFRAIENKRSMVRSTNSGITCLIDPNGVIRKKLDPFIEDYLIVDIPLYIEGQTLYTMWEDWFAYFVILITIIGIFFGIIKNNVMKIKKRLTK